MFKPVLDQAEGKADQVMQKGSSMLPEKNKAHNAGSTPDA